MKMKVTYFENEIVFNYESINGIELENKKMFYRFVTDINNLSKFSSTDDVLFFNENNEELNNQNLRIIFNYFDFEFNARKLNADIVKYLSNSIDERTKDNLIKTYNRFVQLYGKTLNEVDLPLMIKDDCNFDTIIKNIKIVVDEKKDLLDNLFLLIDIENILKTNNIIVFINLKQYLNKYELLELYKYSIYNQIRILLIDSQCYGVTLDYERKLIIDDDLDEFVI